MHLIVTKDMLTNILVPDGVEFGVVGQTSLHGVQTEVITGFGLGQAPTVGTVRHLH